MALFCPDGEIADLPPPGPPPPKPERGAPWKPTEVALCSRCARPSWQHTSSPPLLADELNRAIYAAAFVLEARTREPADDQEAIERAEALVERHRRARSGA